MTIETEKLSSAFDTTLNLEPLTGDALDGEMEEVTDRLAIVLFSVIGIYDHGGNEADAIAAILGRTRADSLRKVVLMVKAARHDRSAGEAG